MKENDPTRKGDEGKYSIISFIIHWCVGFRVLLHGGHCRSSHSAPCTSSGCSGTTTGAGTSCATCG
ncbi:MAG: hypothetical protein ABSE95_09760 [Thermodesulfobacteriota bacterium]